MGTVAANPPPSPSSACGPKLESLNCIDLSKLSQSELQALSLCSNSAFDLRRTDDVVVPNIDRSLFNESAGSRRQTYSRLRGSDLHHHHHHHRARLPGLLPRPKLPPSSDPENHSILHYLKHYLKYNSSSNCPPPPPPPPPPSPPPLPPQQVVFGGLEHQLELGLQEKMAMAVHAAERKRKRGRKAMVNADRRLLENGIGMEFARVNKKGEEVDFTALENNGDELYSGELRKRTMGLETEEGVLEFLRGLEGQWGSRRRKRKYVDASEFGDALPIGWKLLLGLRRRDSRVSVYCRRIVSPTGEQFISCKDAASFLSSYFSGKSRNQLTDQGKCIIEQADGSTSGINAGLVHKADGTEQEIGLNSTRAYLTATDVHENEVCLMGIDNLPEVQVQDLFECYKCNLTFQEKNAYLQHLMSFHQQTTRRYKFGESVGEGVIIKDGKFECQFCHEVFLERSSYNGHVEIHVRNQSKGSELPAPESVQKSTVSPSPDDLCTRTSKMNALIEIAQNLTLAASCPGVNSEAADGSCPTIVNHEGALAGDTNHGMKLSSDPTHMEIESLNSDRPLYQDLNQQGSEYMKADGTVVKTDDRQLVFELNLKSIFTNDSEHSDANAVYSDSDIGIGFEHGLDKLSDDVSKGLLSEHIGNTITSSSLSLSQSLQYFPDVSDKGDCDDSVTLKIEKVTSFEELGLDEMEPLKYDFVDGQGASSLPSVSMDLASGAEVEEGFNSSVGFGSGEIVFNSGTHVVTTVCVWCRAEFEIEAFDSEAQSDSIGYMCSTCKDKISGHFDNICP